MTKKYSVNSIQDTHLKYSAQWVFILQRRKQRPTKWEQAVGNWLRPYNRKEAELQRQIKWKRVLIEKWKAQIEVVGTGELEVDDWKKVTSRISNGVYLTFFFIPSTGWKVGFRVVSAGRRTGKTEDLKVTGYVPTLLWATYCRDCVLASLVLTWDGSRCHL